MKERTGYKLIKRAIAQHEIHWITTGRQLDYSEHRTPDGLILTYKGEATRLDMKVTLFNEANPKGQHTIEYGAGLGSVKNSLQEAGYLEKKCTGGIWGEAHYEIRISDPDKSNRLVFKGPYHDKPKVVAEVQENQNVWEAMMPWYTPDLVDIIYSMACDSAGISNGESFLEWAAEFGYNDQPLSRYNEVYDTYARCQRNWRFLQLLLNGTENARKLVEAYQKGTLED